MKIGILTLPLEANYGGLLQAYALQKILRDMGHDVYTIDWHNRKEYNNIVHQFVGFVGRLVKHYIKREDITTRWNPFVTEKELEIISSKMASFFSDMIKVTDRVYSNQLSVIEDKYKFDAYVVGSDQVWAPSYSYNSCLGFVNRKGVKRITYAASAGKSTWLDIEGELRVSLPYFRLFDAVSVREEGLVEKVHKKTGMQANFVLDPTLLIEKAQYDLLASKPLDGVDYICTYILDNNLEKERIIQQVASKLECNVKYAGLKETFKKGLNPHDYIQPSVEDWLSTYSHSKFVVTDSFHGTVFSIIFNKPFVVIGNKGRGIDRFISLLKLFGLESRLLTDAQSVDDIMVTSIDWNNVNQRLFELREASLSFIYTSLR